MFVIEVDYKWAYAPTKRDATVDGIILHHAAAEKCSVEDVHRWHLANGWAGIGYHFFVRKDGNVYRGRPIDAVGAHTYGENTNAIGICFEGNFENEQMPEAQKLAGAELVSYIKSLIPTIKEVTKHKDHNATACPGKNFPFDFIAAGAPTKTEPEAVKPEETTPVKIQIKAGQVLDLKNEPLFTSAYDTAPKSTVYGTYYIWSDEVINGKIKITNDIGRVGVRGQVTGWIRKPEEAKSETIKQGDTVRLKSGAKTYTGGSLASFVYNRNHVVKELSGDRAVITYGGVVVAAVNVKDLTLVK